MSRLSYEARQPLNENASPTNLQTAEQITSPEETNLLSRIFLREPTVEPTEPSLVATSFDLWNQEHLWRAPATETERRTPETTDTQDSYATVPELSERFFNTLLKQKKPVKLNINTMSGGPSEKKKNPDVEMIDGTPKPTELKLSPPKSFTGKREDLKKFLQDVKLYLHVNKKIYDNDDKQILFALSYMNDGDAASRKEQLLEEAMGKDKFTLGV